MADQTIPGIREVAHTPGPWKWFGNAKTHEIYLATTHSGRRYVMGFQRWGMRGAQPMFQPADRGLVPAERLLTFEVGDQSVRGVAEAKADDSVYRLDIRGIDCADARLIASAPDLLEALRNLRELALHVAELDHPLIAAADRAIAKSSPTPLPTEASHG